MVPCPRGDSAFQARASRDPGGRLRQAKRLVRGKYAEKARRSFGVAILDAELFERFGSSEAIRAALQAVVDAAATVKPPARAKRRVGRASKRPAA